jgi:hypothetical protein
MDFGDSDASEMRFAAYVEGLASVIGHKDRVGHCAIIARGSCCRASARAWSRWRR